MIKVFSTGIDAGKKPVVKLNGSTATVYYVRGGSAHTATAELSSSTEVVRGGRHAYCKQAAPLGTCEVRLTNYGIQVVSI